MTDKFHFSFKNLEEEYRKCLDLGYRIITCQDYLDWKRKKSDFRILVNRVDVDFSLKKAARLGELFKRLKIPATFFIRLHAPEYNPFSFEGYRIIKNLIEAGHEIGYHSEVVDEAFIWKEDAKTCLLRDIEVFNKMFGVNIKGVASHGGMTGFNNLDFWKNYVPSDFGLLYEAYDRQPEFNLFWESRYVSDSEWVRWKAYHKGNKLAGDERSPSQHAAEGHTLLYLLIHSDTYFDHHFYE